MANSLAAILILVSISSCIFGCSIPIGGYTEPTPAELVHFAKHVVVGEVTSRTDVDPAFGNMYGSTYGVSVTVQCSYKGGPLPGTILIGGAGFIPGRCEAMELEVGKQYVLFLDEYVNRTASGHYEQNSPAYPASEIMSFLNICDLKVTYPHEDGVPLKRKACPPSSKLATCVRQGDGSVRSENVGSVNAVNKPAPPTNNTGDAGKVAQTQDGGGGNGGAASIVSSLLITFGLVLPTMM